MTVGFPPWLSKDVSLLRELVTARGVWSFFPCKTHSILQLFTSPWHTFAVSMVMGVKIVGMSLSYRHVGADCRRTPAGELEAAQERELGKGISLSQRLLSLSLTISRRSTGWCQISEWTWILLQFVNRVKWWSFEQRQLQCNYLCESYEKGWTLVGSVLCYSRSPVKDSTSPAFVRSKETTMV